MELKDLKERLDSWEHLYFALAISNWRWWRMFEWRALKHPKVCQWWCRTGGEKDNQKAWWMLDKPDREFVLAKIKDVPSEAAEEMFMSCLRRAKVEVLERKAVSIKEEMREAPPEQRRLLLTQYIEVMKRLKEKQGEECR